MRRARAAMQVLTLLRFSLPNRLFEPLAEIPLRLLSWARFLRRFLEAVAPGRYHSDHDQEHANASSRCGIPLLGMVSDGPTQKQPQTETDEYSAEYLAPSHSNTLHFQGL